MEPIKRGQIFRFKNHWVFLNKIPNKILNEILKKIKKKYKRNSRENSKKIKKI